MNKQRKTSHILNVFQYDADGHVVLPASLTLTVAPAGNDNSGKVGTTAWVRSYVAGLSYLTGNQSISVSGDATGSGTTAISLTLANSGVTAGTYGSTTLVPVVTVDAKGRVTNVTTAAISGSLTFTGDVTGTGTTGTSTGLTLAASGVTAGTYTKVTVDTKGRVTVGASATTSDISEGTNLYYTDARVLAYLGANNYATQSYVSTQINNLVSGAPGLLDTLDELAAALGDDPNFATTTATSLGNRLRVDTAAQGLNSTQQSNGRTNLGLGSLATLSSIGNSYITDLAWSKLSSTPTTISGYGITNAYTDAQIQNFFNGANAISGYNKSNWDTAYGWGNHASAGYLTTSSASSTYLTSATAATTYVSLTGSYANPSWITSLAYSKLTGVPSTFTPSSHTHAISEVTGLQTALDGKQASLGFTPYNSTNPSGYVTSSNWAILGGGVSYNIDRTTKVSSGLAIYSAYTGGANSPTTYDISAQYVISGRAMEMAASWHSPSAVMYFRTLRDCCDNWSAWVTMLSSANYNDYAPTKTGGGAIGSWGISVTGSAGSVAWTNVTSRPTALSSFTNDLGNYGGWITSSGNISGYAMSLNGYAGQTEYVILTGPANGPVIKVRYDGATANRYIDIGSKDGNGVYSEGLKIYNGGTLTFGGYTIYHSGNIPTWNQNTTGTSSNITAYTINQSVGTSNAPTFTNIYNNAWFRNNNVNEGVYNQATGVHFYSGSATGWTVTGSGGTVELVFRSNHQTTIRGYVYADTSNNIGFLTNDGNWGLQVDSSKNVKVFGADLTVGNSTSSNIYMTDTDESTRRIHCNSGRIGFLTTSNGWGAYCDNSGNWFANNLSGTNTGDQTNISGNAATATNVAWSGVTSKPSHIMYYQSFTLDANTMDANSTGFTYSVNAPFTGPIARFSAGGSYDMWLGGNYGGSGNVFYIRTRNGDAGAMNPWRLLITDGNIGSQTVSSASTVTHYASRADGTWYNVVWAAGNPSHMYSSDAVMIRSSDGTIRANVFYDNQDTGYYLDANSESNLYRFTSTTMTRNAINYLSINSPFTTRAAQTRPYQNGTMGWSTTDFNVIFSNWGSGFIDSWSSPANSPDNGIATHWVGFQSLHYNHENNTNGYGFQMVYGGGAGHRYFWRNAWASLSGWVEMIHTGNIGSQSVNYATTAGSANSVAWSNVSSRPTTTSAFTNDSGYITSGSNVVGLYSSGFGNGNFTWYQSPGGLQQYGGSWASFLISNHGAGVDYYNQTIIMPFWGAPQYMRKEGGTNRGPYTFFTTENYDPSNYGGNFTANGYIRVNANNNLYLDYNHGQSIVGIYSSYRYQGVYSMGDAYKLAIDGTTPGNLYGMSWSHPNAGGQASRLNDHGLMIMINGVTQAAISSNIWAAGDVTAFSDARVKDNIEVINNAVEKIQAIRGVTFTRNDMTDTTTRHAGVIAQEVLEVLPEVITKDANDHYSVAYGNLNALLIEAIKEQQGQIEELKRQINYLVENK
jgi:hypothetical protein